MGKSKGLGFYPRVLDYDGDKYMYMVLDMAIVDAATGCWLYQGDDLELAAKAQFALLDAIGRVPEGHSVYNTCNDYAVCFNPYCLAVQEESA